MSSTTQIKSQRDTQNVPQGPLPSELLPTSVTQPPLIDLTQSLQARTLQEQLKAFVSPDLIKHGEQVLFRPQVTNDVHIITATADIVPKAIITSLTLFLEIQLFMASQSAGFDAQLHAYTPADRMLPTLAQIRCSRPHIKSKVASVESQLASACTQVLNTAQANPKVPLRDHQLQYCRTRLTIALYTSSTILLKVRGRKPDEKAHLSSWQYVEVDEKFLLILKTAEQKTVEKLIKIVSIYSQKDDEEVKLSSLTDEMILIDQIHQSILSGEDAPTTNDRSQGQISASQSAAERKDPKRAFNSSDMEAGGFPSGLKRKRMSRTLTHNTDPDLTLAQSQQQPGIDLTEDDELSDAARDTEPLEA